MMRSPFGFWASLVFLALLPIAILYQAFFDQGVEIVLHVVLGTGSTLMARAVFQFNTPRWSNGIGGACMGLLAAVFLLQALSLSVPNDGLNRLAFGILGQGLESVLADGFFLWCITLALTHSIGKTKIFGIVIVTLVVCLEIYKYSLTLSGGAMEDSLKLPFLLLFLWILLESRKAVTRS